MIVLLCFALLCFVLLPGRVLCQVQVRVLRLVVHLFIYWFLFYILLIVSPDLRELGGLAMGSL